MWSHHVATGFSSGKSVKGTWVVREDLYALHLAWKCEGKKRVGGWVAYHPKYKKEKKKGKKHGDRERILEKKKSAYQNDQNSFSVHCVRRLEHVIFSAIVECKRSTMTSSVGSSGRGRWRCPWRQPAAFVQQTWVLTERKTWEDEEEEGGVHGQKIRRRRRKRRRRSWLAVGC